MADKANKPLADEAAGTTLKKFTYQSTEFTVETDGENWSIETMLAYEDGRSVGMVKSLVGETEWAKFMAKKPSNKEFSEFSQKVFEAIGVTEGESEG